MGLLEKAGVNRELLATARWRTLSYYGHIIRIQGDSLEKEIIQGTFPGSRRKGGQRMTWMNNIAIWTNLQMVWTC